MEVSLSSGAVDVRWGSSGARPDRFERRFASFIATSFIRALRPPLEFAQYTSEQFQKLLSDHGILCSMSRSGNVWDNAAMESFFSSLKTERTARKTYRTHDQAKADVCDYIECFYNPKRRHSTIGYLSPVEFAHSGLRADRTGRSACRSACVQKRELCYVSRSVCKCA